MIQNILNILEAQWLDLLLFTGSGIAVLIWLGVRGKLSANIFDDAPGRDLKLSVFDLAGGYSFLIVGMIFVSALMLSFDKLDTETGTFKGDATQQAGWGLIGQTARYLPVMIFLFWRLHSQADGARQFGFLPRRPLRELGAAALGLAVALPLTFGTSAVVTTIAEMFSVPSPVIGHEMLKQMVTTQQTPAIILMFVSAVFAAPLFEEILFRGLIQSSLLSIFQNQRWWLILISSVIFSLIHIGSVAWQTLPALFVLGLVLGWLYERYGSLWPCILVHAGFNLVNIALAMSQIKYGGLDNP